MSISTAEPRMELALAQKKITEDTIETLRDIEKQLDASESSPTNVPRLDLQAIRDELSEAHRECFKELHRLEGELRGVDKFLAFLNPQAPHQPATTAEGETA